METNRDNRGPGIVRQTDIEPYTGLRWVSRLFKAASIFLFIAMMGELVAGLRYEGLKSMPVLLGEAARTFVVAVVLWAGGDLVRLFVHLGHDIRAERILLARLVSRMPTPETEEAQAGTEERELEVTEEREMRAAEGSEMSAAESATRGPEELRPERGAAD